MADPAADARAGDDAAGATGESGARAEATVRSATTRHTNRWVGIAGLAFLTAGIGVFVRSRPLVLAAVVIVGYLAYANVFDDPSVSLAVGRRLDERAPDPGDEIRVTVTVENTGDAVLPDLRVIDQVPEALEVVAGPARTATALRPGARMTFSYTVVARRGEYRFDGLTVLARDFSGSVERELDLSTAAETVTVVSPLDGTTAVPLAPLTSPYTGRVETDSGGEGVEFYAVREYRHGDPLSRIDWNRFARERSLSTLEFREERMATVVLVLDLRAEAYLQAGEDGRHAVDREIDAAGRLFRSLLGTGDRVGIAAFAPADVWLPPGAGKTHRARARHLLATHPALSPTPPERDVYTRTQLRDLETRLSEETQILFLSPMPDPVSAYVVRSLHTRGHPVTVVSPDPTRTDTPGHLYEHLERSNRLNDLRTSGVRVLDWADDESLAETLERGRRRWSL
jgi:uncharacterized repeat protein (TIGR01451 family)